MGITKKDAREMLWALANESIDLQKENKAMKEKLEAKMEQNRGSNNIVKPDLEFLLKRLLVDGIGVHFETRNKLFECYLWLPVDVLSRNGFRGYGYSPYQSFRDAERKMLGRPCSCQQLDGVEACSSCDSSIPLPAGGE